jgi:hypothetical protein
MNTDNIERTPPAAARVAWEAYKTAVTSYFNALRGINAAFAVVFPERIAVGVPTRYKHAELLINMARSLQKELIYRAEEEFGSTAVRLSIDETAVMEAFPLERPAYSDDDDADVDVPPFNPEGVWAWLESKYGGERGENEALRQAAERLREAFDLDRQAPRHQSGYLVLDLRVYIDSMDKKYSKVNRLHYHAETSVQQALSALVDFAKATDRPMLRFGVESLRQRINRHHDIRSREKFAIGDKGTELLLITYLDRFEFRLRADTAEDLQIFLGTHLAPAAA